jgi:hypothetical protein
LHNGLLELRVIGGFEIEWLSQRLKLQHQLATFPTSISAVLGNEGRYLHDPTSDRVSQEGKENRKSHHAKIERGIGNPRFAMDNVVVAMGNNPTTKDLYRGEHVQVRS